MRRRKGRRKRKERRRRRLRSEKKSRMMLSFDAEEIVEEPEKLEKKKEKAPVTKNPDVATDFLPDKERDEKIQMEKDRQKKEWLQRQIEMKNELVEVTYSYWDGHGHRRKTSVKKGTTISSFLEKVRKDLVNDFHELKRLNGSDLMYVKEDIILPSDMTFYKLIVSKARGKSGPLFHFDVHDDVRLVNDVRIEKDESHPGKVCERSWYEKHKHIFPASRWEQFDPDKSFDKYTLKSL
mmetsp:Transcript_13337/g.17376  ORF Transcript_13337/g.17376 Transcript_13337/m.17376 type:complete len:237 (+) Transcript_13337:454-1164(+)